MVSFWAGLGFRSRARGKGRTLPETVHRVELQGDLSGLIVASCGALPGLVVMDVGSSQAVQQWNNQNPNQRIEVGYAVLEINGITDPKAMLEQFRNAESLKMLINTELTLEQRAIFRTLAKVYKSSIAASEVLSPVDPDATLVPEACAICHDNMGQAASLAQLPCGHRFHHKCVTRWLVHGKCRCPLCNHDLVLRPLVRRPVA